MTSLPQAGRVRRWSLLGSATLIAGGLLAGVPSTAGAQEGDRMTPSPSYYIVFADFYEGEYKDALKDFLAEGRGAIKTVQSRWIDSICYHTMAGECYYHMGDLTQALDHYSSALKLYSAFPGWMINVQFPPRITAAGRGKYMSVPWGASKRSSRLGHFPDRMLISQGQIDHNQVVREGGVLKPAMLFPIQPAEIVRCTTLAIRRYAELMGPLCPHDPLINDVAAKLSRRPGPPNHWSEAWIDVQAGLALMAVGKEEQGLPLLQRSILAAGEYDHPLTCVALLELGKMAMRKGQYPAAAKYLEEATYVAVHFGNVGVLEEAFRYGAVNHLISNSEGMYPPLEAAAKWANVKDLRQLRASVLLAAAENAAVLGATPQAASLLDEAERAIGRRSMASGWIGARLSFLRALVLFQQKRIPAGNEALAAAMSYMQRGSHWLFQMGLADRLYLGGRVSQRVAMDLFTEVLRDPTAGDWALDPMQSMSVLVTPHPAPLEHWFEVAMARKEHETAIEISDRIRRHRFFSSLGFGGRLASLRWILEAPADVLPEPAQLQRQHLLATYPTYDGISKQARQIRQKLEAMPPVAEEKAAAQQQAKALEELAAVSALQEALLREIALRREPSDLVFPPLKTTREILQGLPKGNALLAFLATSRGLYGFLLADQQYTYWQVKSATFVGKQAQALLREMGHHEQNRVLAYKELSDARWKQSAEQLLKMLLEGSRADLSQIRELAIVPDGLLWYVPFEALQQEVNGKLEPLILRIRVRYAPTASLAVADGRARRPSATTAVVVGNLFPRDDDRVAQAAFKELARVAPGSVALPTPLPAPTAVYGLLFDQLVVLDDIVTLDRGPLGWSPVQIERNKPGNTLDDWLTLPFGGPDVIVLPGFHTAAENALKKTGAAPGMDVFLALCGLTSDGARTVLLSRWRTGGRSAFELVREFVQELPHTTPADAWQRAVLVTAAQRIDPETEPRVQDLAGAEPPKANHPFFWAGYMLVDPGVPAQKPAPKTPAPKPGIQPALPLPPSPKPPAAKP